MERKWVSRVCAGVYVLCSLACFNAAANSKAEESDQLKRTQSSVNPNSLTVSADAKTVEIRLVSNKTTGYSWFLERYNSKLIKPLSYHYIVPSVSMVGAPGVSVWTFQVLPHAVPIHDRITWVSVRPWEKLEKPTYFTTDIYFLDK